MNLSAPATAGTKMILDPALAAQVADLKSQISALLKIYHYRKSLVCVVLSKLRFGHLESRQPPICLHRQAATRKWLDSCVIYFEREMEMCLDLAKELEYDYKNILLTLEEKWEAEEAAERMQGGPQGQMDGETEG